MSNFGVYLRNVAGASGHYLLLSYIVGEVSILALARLGNVARFEQVTGGQSGLGASGAVG